MKSFLELNRSFTILAIVIFVPCFVSEIWIWFVLLVLKFLSRFLFFRCLIFKVRIAPKSYSISSPAFALAERSYIIPNHIRFVNTFLKLFSNFTTFPRVYHYTYTFYQPPHLILWFLTIYYINLYRNKVMCFKNYPLSRSLIFFFCILQDITPYAA